MYKDIDPDDPWFFRHFNTIFTIMFVGAALFIVIQVGAVIFVGAKTVDAVQTECSDKDAASCAGSFAGKFKRAMNEAEAE